LGKFGKNEKLAGWNFAFLCFTGCGAGLFLLCSTCLNAYRKQDTERLQMTARRFLLGMIILGWAFFAALAGTPAQAGEPAVLSPEPADLQLHDDLGYESLALAIDRSLRYLGLLPPEKSFTLCGEPYPVAWLAESLLVFKKLLAEHPDPSSLTAVLAQDFQLCQASGLDGHGKMLITGYYEPVCRASLTRSEAYPHPLYGRPPDLLSAGPGPDWERRNGRLVNGALVPYFTRAEIEKGSLLAGQELAWLADPLEAFILHVQGSGWLEFADGTRRRVQFAAKNGREYRSIGRLLVDRGIMSREEATMPAILNYLREHPAEQEAILHHNESFVFFRWGDDMAVGPLGSLGQPLTPGRSVALDQDHFPPGALAWLATRQPVINEAGEITGWQALGRFVLNQDSGSAITGPGRLDLFFGAGPQAEAAAGSLKHPGMLYFLVKKK